MSVAISLFAVVVLIVAACGYGLLAGPRWRKIVVHQGPIWKEPDPPLVPGTRVRAAIDIPERNVFRGRGGYVRRVDRDDDTWYIVEFDGIKGALRFRDDELDQIEVYR